MKGLSYQFVLNLHDLKPVTCAPKLGPGLEDQLLLLGAVGFVSAGSAQPGEGALAPRLLFPGPLQAQLLALLGAWPGSKLCLDGWRFSMFPSARKKDASRDGPKVRMSTLGLWNFELSSWERQQVLLTANSGRW